MCNAMVSTVARVLGDASALLGLVLILGAICVFDGVGADSQLVAQSQELTDAGESRLAPDQLQASGSVENAVGFENSLSTTSRLNEGLVTTDTLPTSSVTDKVARSEERLGTVERDRPEGGVIVPPQSTGIVESTKPTPVVERPAEVLAPTPVETPRRKESMEVEFFETRARAETVAFVVDCSGSMSGEKYDQVRLEIIRSIGKLEAQQSFYVALFNHGFIPMFHASATPKMAIATPETNSRIFEWLRESRPGGGTNPQPALLAMVALKPDVIYLLTDGIFSKLRPETLAALKTNSIVVHTIGFGNDADQNSLNEISNQTGGVFRAVAPSRPGNRHLANADPSIVRAELNSGRESQQVLAIEVAEVKMLPFEADVIELLTSPSLSVRTAASQFLLRRSQQLNLGPKNLQDVSEVANAQKYWREWLQLRQADAATITAACRDAVGDKRLVAAALAGRMSVEMTPVLIPMLRDASPELRRAVHHSLVKLNRGTDLGPDDEGNLDLSLQAASRWSDWWDRKRRESDEAKAAELLRVAKALLSNGSHEEGSRRLQSIVKKYPDTLAAEDARKLLPKSP